MILSSQFFNVELRQEDAISLSQLEIKLGRIRDKTGSQKTNKLNIKSTPCNYQDPLDSNIMIQLLYPLLYCDNLSSIRQLFLLRQCLCQTNHMELGIFFVYEKVINKSLQEHISALKTDRRTCRPAHLPDSLFDFRSKLRMRDL